MHLVIWSIVIPAAIGGVVSWCMTRLFLRWWIK